MTFRRRTLVLFLLATVALGAWWFLHEPAPVAVKVQPVALGTVEEIVANTRAGTLKPCRRAKLAPSLGGQIAILAVREGDRVKTGDLLLELWNQDLTAQVSLAEREAEAAEARARSACLNAENAERDHRKKQCVILLFLLFAAWLTARAVVLRIWPHAALLCCHLLLFPYASL